MKNKTLFIITVFLLAISCANANLLINGFFENGSVGTQFGAAYPTGWTGSGWNGWHAGDPGRVHDGYGIVIWGNDTHIRQRVDVTASQSYTFSANMYHSDQWNNQIPDWDYPLADQDALVRITFYNSGGGTVGSSRYPVTLTESHATNTWHRFTDTFTVPTTAVELEVRCYLQHTGSSPSGKAFWDDLILTTDTFNVPETDFDDDGHVTLADFGGISGKWQEVSAKYDMTGDGLINIDDFILFAIDWLEDTTTKNGYDLVWYDGFNGTSLDTSNWSYDIGNGSSGWGNNEKQYYTSRSDNIRLEDGNLVIEAKEESYGGQDYTSAKIHSYGKVSVRYGRIEARIKIPTSQGLWPAFWMMPVDNTFYGDGWPASGEIDIMESVNYNNETVGMLHFGQNDGDGYVADSTWWAPGYTNDPIGDNLSDDFHVYAVEWDVTEIRWYVDDNLFFTAVNSQWWTGGSGNASAPFDRDFYLILNVAVGGRWPKNPDNSSIFPQKMLVDYVKIYD